MATDHNLSKQQGLVISYFGNSVAVEAHDGQVFQCQLHRNQELPVVGDLVTWQKEESNNCVIDAIMPRKSLMARADSKGKMKPIAANVDAIFIVMSPPPIFAERLIDRYIIAAELLNIQPVIIVNKDDLLKAEDKEDLLARVATYQSVPYNVILSNTVNTGGLDELSQFLKHKTAALVGPSGVGKSSIISKLSQNDIVTSEVSARGAGKHTTTATRLYHLPDGGALIDSPGVRDFSLWTIDKQDVISSFKEFKSYDCKFRDCQHTVEPGCGIKAAVEAGKISAKRYETYLGFMRLVQPKHAK